MPPTNSPAALSPSDPASSDTTAPASSSAIPYQRPLTPLSYLSSPVPDLAATLHTVAADAVDEANVSFLRSSLETLDQTSAPASEPFSASQSHIDPQRRLRRSYAQGTLSPSEGQGRTATTSALPAAAAAVAAATAETVEDLSRRERLQRVLARLNRIHDPSGSSTSAYSNRTPSPHRQSLYDWAPSHEGNANPDDADLDVILAELRRQQPDTHSSILRVLSQSQLEGSRRRDREGSGMSGADASEATAAARRDRLREREHRLRDPEWVSLRSRNAARARQDGSPSATERILRYVMERERSGLSEEEERARGTGWFRPHVARAATDDYRDPSASAYSRDPWPLPPPPPPADESRLRAVPERAEAAQRRYLAEHARPRLPRISTPPIPSTIGNMSSSSATLLENAFKYLGDLRSCHRYEDALSAAIDRGLATKEFFADKHDDFIMDLNEIHPLSDSSWLQPSTVFDGHQHAMHGNHGVVQHSSASTSLPPPHSLVEQINPNYRTSRVPPTGFDHPPGSTRMTTPFDAARPWLSHRFTPPATTPTSHLHDPTHDHWPVRVIIHAIDSDRMVLQGTMEAYDVPQHPNSISILSHTTTDRPKAGKKHEPITTYLEGHIIDLATHSFITPGAAEQKQHGPHSTSPENSTPYSSLSTAISFPPANAHTDANNWRRLPPFNAMASDDEAARCLLSKARIDEVNNSYIFMRWKERCFVHSKDDQCAEADRHGDGDRGHGLTISGFYYVSLRRSDGAVEGLYFDPTSTLYQHLKLRGRVDGWPAIAFR